MDNNKPVVNVTEQEIELLKRTFAGNEEFLKSIRALMFGLDVTDAEKEQIKSTFSNKELLKIVTRRFYPTLDKDAKIGQVGDVWLGVEQMVFGQSPSAIYQAVQYKNEALKLTKKALALLENPYGDKIDIGYNLDLVLKDEYQVWLLARNQYLRHVESQLAFLYIIAGTEKETPSQAEVRKEKNSAK